MLEKIPGFPEGKKEERWGKIKESEMPPEQFEKKCQELLSEFEDDPMAFIGRMLVEEMKYRFEVLKARQKSGENIDLDKKGKELNHGLGGNDSATTGIRVMLLSPSMRDAIIKDEELGLDNDTIEKFSVSNEDLFKKGLDIEVFELLTRKDIEKLPVDLQAGSQKIMEESAIPLYKSLRDAIMPNIEEYLKTSE